MGSALSAQGDHKHYLMGGVGEVWEMQFCLQNRVGFFFSIKVSHSRVFFSTENQYKENCQRSFD